MCVSELSEPLDRCLSLWRSLLKGSVPAVRDPKLTAYSMTLMAALYTLIGKVRLYTHITHGVLCSISPASNSLPRKVEVFDICIYVEKYVCLC